MIEYGVQVAGVERHFLDIFICKFFVKKRNDLWQYSFFLLVYGKIEGSIV